ncbi:transcription antitermination factor NusB [Spirochaeta africana]|uniref:Transcription antitermination protein NusB n=1 Tax=Spirochaeta africana (strain ATCC 700263 / DSM 8902 / Z-7692) TaxID=889378 RepID=H9UJJ1_SPIAZ|nr:transcription antitermination factor NusB [Spirochaeta africana]AFG37684.1 transcription antitermination factor NusB [Spirochaeta africana DSM 8902]
MASRRKGRIAAFQALYACGCGAVSEDLDFQWAANSNGEQPEWIDFARLLFSGTLEHLQDIDANIERHLEHWDLARIRKVDLAILRMSTYALLYQPGIPAGVTIDEAVHIAKEYGTDESYRFINGVLDSIHKQGSAE